MTIKDIETRCAEIREAMTSEDADLKSLIEEAKELKTRKAELIEVEMAEAKAKELEVETRKAEMSEVMSGKGEVIERNIEMAEKVEVRNTKEYIDAFAEYIKSGSDAECRALLTENVSGTVPVPEMVYDIVKTAWEKNGITSLVRKTAIKGNLKVGFEISGTGAVKHTEGAEAIDPETLVLGVVNIIPASVKKAIQISDEVLDMRGSEFLNYIYDELTYRIAKEIAKEIIDTISACGTVSTTTCPSVKVLSTASIGVGTIAQAIAKLSDEADNPVVVCSKPTWADFMGVQAGANYGQDIFYGLPVVYCSELDDYTGATTGDTFAIVGDFGHGVIANFPEGDGITFKYNDLTLAKQDLVEIIGREYVGIGVVAPDSFVKIKKA